MADSSVLVDSSLWIEALRSSAPDALRRMLGALVETNHVVITDMIRLEVIAGARSSEEFVSFRADFEALRCLPTTPRVWQDAEELSLSLGRRGARVPAADLLIAAVAIAHGVPLWHADRDFERVRKTVPELRTFWHPHQTPPFIVPS